MVAIRSIIFRLSKKNIFQGKRNLSILLSRRSGSGNHTYIYKRKRDSRLERIRRRYNLDIPPADNDRIEIFYRKNTGSTGGDVLFATANRFLLSDEWTADLNAGLRLNISEGYALPGEETSAFGGISAGIEWDNTEKESPLSIKNRAHRRNKADKRKLNGEPAA